MRQIPGKWNRAQTSDQEYALLSVDAWGTLFVSDNNGCLAEASLADVEISDRLGRLPRRLYFPGEGSFITTDNDSIDEIQQQFGQSSLSQLVHKIESNSLLVCVFFLLVVASAFAVYKYGIPYAAERVSITIPDKMLSIVDERALEELDDGYFAQTKLTKAKQSKLLDYFSRYEEEKRNVVFRDGGKVVGANALALPAGTIIFTDQLVNLAQDDEELLAIYFHETAHVKNRHGVRSVLQSSAMALFITFITGDGSGIAEVIYTLPIILLHSAYSRNFEIEADAYAKTMMQTHNIPLSKFRDIMLRLRAQSSGNSEGGFALGDYFSTHPTTVKRLEAFTN